MNKNTVYILQKDLPFAKAGAEFIRENEDADYYNTNFANYHDRIHKSRVINNIEWFKPKEEPQWEILAYVVNNGVRCTLRSNGKYLNEEFESNNNWGGTLEDVLKYIEKGEGFIESVKRFPDNTVWSVDMVTNNGRITGFHIEKGIMVAEFENNTRHCDLMLLIKAPKEEQVPIKVLGLLDGINTDNPPYGKYYTLIFNNSIPESKYQSIREAIEDVLNNKYKPWKMYQTGFTSEELLQARRDAFDAAREVNYVNDAFFNDHYESLKRAFIKCSKHKSSEYYINSLNK